VRLECPAITHHGHTLNSYRLLYYRFRTGYIFGIGEVIRAAVGTRYLRTVLFKLRELRLIVLIWVSWVAITAVPFLVPSNLLSFELQLLILLLPVGLMALRHHSIKLGLYSIVTWHIYALSFLFGFFRKRKVPTAPIQSCILRAAEIVPKKIGDDLPISKCEAFKH
jgi:hypothetical protein